MGDEQLRTLERSWSQSPGDSERFAALVHALRRRGLPVPTSVSRWERLAPRPFNTPLAIELEVELPADPPQPFGQGEWVRKRFPRFLNKTWNVPEHHRMFLRAHPPTERTGEYMLLVGEVLRTQLVPGLELRCELPQSPGAGPLRWGAARERFLSELHPENLGDQSLRWLALSGGATGDRGLGSLLYESLEDLSLTNVHGKNEGSACSLAGVGDLSALARLALTGCTVDGHELSRLLARSELSELVLRFAMPRERAPLYAALQRHDALESLDVNQADELLLLSLRGHAGLRELAFQGSLDDEAYAPLRSLPALRYLRPPAEIGDEALEHLPPGLDVLDLDPSCSLTPAALHGLIEHPSLRVVRGLAPSEEREAALNAFEASKPERSVTWGSSGAY